MTLSSVEQDIERFILENEDLREFRDLHPAAFQGHLRWVIWIVKYIPSSYLIDFLALSQVRISSTAGFTWGDAVYAASLKHPYSSMMYGRAGIVGYVDLTRMSSVFRADKPEGVELYQRWIPYQRHWYEMLTTTLHADTANRELRNAFRRRFSIDVVVCPPDQEGGRYTDRQTDRWFAISDWRNLGPGFTSRRRGFTDVVKDCKWVAIVGEDFVAEEPPIVYRDHFGSAPHTCDPAVILSPPGGNSGHLDSLLRQQHANTPNAQGEHQVVVIRTDT